MIDTVYCPIAFDINRLTATSFHYSDTYSISNRMKVATVCDQAPSLKVYKELDTKFHTFLTSVRCHLRIPDVLTHKSIQLDEAQIFSVQGFENKNVNATSIIAFHSGQN